MVADDGADITGEKDKEKDTAEDAGDTDMNSEETADGSEIGEQNENNCGHLKTETRGLMMEHKANAKCIKRKHETHREVRGRDSLLMV